MPDLATQMINPVPGQTTGQPFDMQQAQLERKRKLIEAMMAGSMQRDNGDKVVNGLYLPGALGDRVAPQMAPLIAAMQERGVNSDELALEEQRQKAMQGEVGQFTQTYAKDPKQAVVQALSSREPRMQQLGHLLLQFGQKEPPMVESAMFAAGGDKTKAMPLVEKALTNPQLVGMLNAQVAQGNLAANQARTAKEIEAFDRSKEGLDPATQREVIGKLLTSREKLEPTVSSIGSLDKALGLIKTAGPYLGLLGEAKQWGAKAGQEWSQFFNGKQAPPPEALSAAQDLYNILQSETLQYNRGIDQNPTEWQVKKLMETGGIRMNPQDVEFAVNLMKNRIKQRHDEYNRDLEHYARQGYKGLPPTIGGDIAPNVSVDSMPAADRANLDEALRTGAEVPIQPTGKLKGYGPQPSAGPSPSPQPDPAVIEGVMKQFPGLANMPPEARARFLELHLKSGGGQ